MQAAGFLVTRRDSYNETQKLVRVELAGRSPIKALLNHLRVYCDDDGRKFIWYYCLDNSQRVQELFFMHPVSKDIITRSADVIQIDATYKINRFNTPLLHIMGTDCRHKVFDIAYSSMSRESTDVYKWYIRRLKFVFTSLKIVPVYFITDNDRKLKPSLTYYYPKVPQRLYIWYINQNVIA